MRILHIIYTHGISGAEKYLDYLLPGLKEYDIHCDVIFICPASSQKLMQGFADQLTQKGIPSSVIAAGRINLFSTIRKINRYVKDHNIRIIHSHLLNTDILAALLKFIFNRSIFLISTKHGYQEAVLNVYTPEHFKVKRDLYYYITRFTLSQINKNVTISKGMANLFVNLRLTKEQFPVIHHGITVQAPAPSASAVYRKAPQQLIITGRLEIMKGHEYLLKAMPQIVKQYPECKLLVLGEGSLKAQLRQLCTELNIERNVEFLGFQSDPYSFIANSDVVILPSLFEPFGLVYIESKALKTPVVAFDTPAANELIINGETGMLVPRLDSKALAERTLQLLNNKELASAIAEKAYASYLQHFTSAIMIKNTADWYRSVYK